MKYKIHKILSIPFAIIVILLQRALSPFVKILITNFSIDRIGGPYRYYWLDCQPKSRKPIVKFFITPHRVANEKWLEIFRSKFIIFNFNVYGDRVLNWNRKLSDWKKFETKNITLMDLMRDREMLKNIISKEEAYFDFEKVFTIDDKIKGKEILKKMGVPDGCEFFCFHNRDTAFLDKTLPQMDNVYHNYRDSSIINYEGAAEYFTTKGLVGIRAGAFVKEKIHSQSPMLFDYPNTDYRSEFMDVYLGARCKFFISTDTGITIVPELFDRPVLYANWVPLARVSVWVKNGLFIPKHFIDQKSGRELSFHEILGNDQLTLQPETKNFEEAGIILVENTREEILEAATEFYERINGTWVDSKEMEKLQTIYWDLSPYIKYKSSNYNISSKYLLRNQHLLLPSASVQGEQVS